MAGDQQEQQYDAQDQASSGDPGAQPAEVDDLAEAIAGALRNDPQPVLGR